MKNTYIHSIFSAALSIIPMVLIVVLLSVIRVEGVNPVVSLSVNDYVALAIGAIVMIVGLGLFQVGAANGLAKVGEYMGSSLSKQSKLFVVIIFSFLLGTLITCAEPSILIVATQVNIPAYLLRATLNLESISIPNSVKSIGKYAFNGSAIHSIIIPDSVNSIGENAFAYCQNLSTVTLGKTIGNIGNDIFIGCPIKNLTVYAEIPPEGGLESGISNTTCKLYVPEDYLNVYTNTIWWEDFFDIQPINNSGTSISNIACEGYPSIKILRNGQLLILRGDKVYTVDGRLVR